MAATSSGKTALTKEESSLAQESNGRKVATSTRAIPLMHVSRNNSNY